jgi:hypothetical protein
VVENKKTLVVLIIIWIIVALAGGTYYKLKNSTKVINQVELVKKARKLLETGKFESVKFYYPNGNFTELKTKDEDIPVYYKKRDKIEKIAERSFENLYLTKILTTPQIDVKNVYIAGDTVYIDCEPEIGALKEPTKKNILGIYSIVNSITEVPGINKVKILVDEKEQSGNFSRIYTRNMNF